MNAFTDEDLKKEKLAKHCHEVTALIKETQIEAQRSFLKLGALLAEVKDSGLWEHGGYTSWPSYVVETTGYSSKTADKYISLSKFAKRMFEKGKNVQALSFEKLSILSHAVSPEKYVDQAEVQGLTDLRESIQEDEEGIVTEDRTNLDNSSTLLKENEKQLEDNDASKVVENPQTEELKCQGFTETELMELYFENIIGEALITKDEDSLTMFPQRVARDYAMGKVFTNTPRKETLTVPEIIKEVKEWNKIPEAEKRKHILFHQNEIAMALKETNKAWRKQNGINEEDMAKDQNIQLG